ncbi:exported hypothetical protein [Cupriavidus taiwanensis]|nr:exported hypothetical protein [Cupriavidus taiwanensis]
MLPSPFLSSVSAPLPLALTFGEDTKSRPSL